MKSSIALIVALVALCGGEAFAQQARVTASGGEVASSRVLRRDPGRLAPTIPSVTRELRARLRVTGDSAQRIALDDFDWRGRVRSVEVGEQDSRLFWDVRIVPDTTRRTIVRYRIDATSGGILDIREFIGVRGPARNPPL